uniref:Uncharacterized protein n=1 Tax=Chromera velia CCMP2878 TaxID=1169474 RepID=A0A0G4HH96_9ALVE|eukprot:Cvel_6856.t1-p1 / transcript=Cvel_6856.t1 / gene=Cvel_6856 / organism=Chromera_velia_CCMP2878 / gene_product=hypothetical protein / transcript_product=hypothetical protein / location=Cvel_scaffold346:11057-18857(-) / protein_length=1071 / sequence_SO=supercontig / SO=protein_coding / is_pseudo=false
MWAEILNFTAPPYILSADAGGLTGSASLLLGLKNNQPGAEGKPPARENPPKREPGPIGLHPAGAGVTLTETSQARRRLLPAQRRGALLGGRETHSDNLVAVSPSSLPPAERGGAASSVLSLLEGEAVDSSPSSFLQSSAWNDRRGSGCPNMSIKAGDALVKRLRSLEEEKKLAKRTLDKQWPQAVLGAMSVDNPLQTHRSSEMGVKEGTALSEAHAKLQAVRETLDDPDRNDLALQWPTVRGFLERWQKYDKCSPGSSTPPLGTRGTLTGEVPSPCMDAEDRFDPDFFREAEGFLQTIVDEEYGTKETLPDDDQSFLQLRESERSTDDSFSDDGLTREGRGKRIQNLPKSPEEQFAQYKHYFTEALDVLARSRNARRVLIQQLRSLDFLWVRFVRSLYLRVYWPMPQESTLKMQSCFCDSIFDAFAEMRRFRDRVLGLKEKDEATTETLDLPYIRGVIDMLPAGEEVGRLAKSPEPPLLKLGRLPLERAWADEYDSEFGDILLDDSCLVEDEFADAPSFLTVTSEENRRRKKENTKDTEADEDQETERESETETEDRDRESSDQVSDSPLSSSFLQTEMRSSLPVSVDPLRTEPVMNRFRQATKGFAHGLDSPTDPPAFRLIDSQDCVKSIKDEFERRKEARESELSSWQDQGSKGNPPPEKTAVSVAAVQECVREQLPPSKPFVLEKCLAVFVSTCESWRRQRWKMEDDKTLNNFLQEVRSAHIETDSPDPVVKFIADVGASLGSMRDPPASLTVLAALLRRLRNSSDELTGPVDEAWRKGGDSALVVEAVKNIVFERRREDVLRALRAKAEDQRLGEEEAKEKEDAAVAEVQKETDEWANLFDAVKDGIPSLAVLLDPQPESSDTSATVHTAWRDLLKRLRSDSALSVFVKLGDLATVLYGADSFQTAAEMLASRFKDPQAFLQIGSSSSSSQLEEGESPQGGDETNEGSSFITNEDREPPDSAVSSEEKLKREEREEENQSDSEEEEEEGGREGRERNERAYVPVPSFLQVKQVQKHRQQEKEGQRRMQQRAGTELDTSFLKVSQSVLSDKDGLLAAEAALDIEVPED